MPNFRAVLALFNGPHSVSLNLNKSISYLSLCLSLNSFCDETSRIWASLGPETKYHRSWLGLSPSHVGSSPKQGFGWIWVPATWVWVPNKVLAEIGFQPPGFKSQAEFWQGLRPSHAGLSPKLGFDWVWALAMWVRVPVWGKRIQNDHHMKSTDSLWVMIVQLTIFWLYNGEKVLQIQ